MVAAVIAACTSLPPLFLSTRQTADEDFDDTFFGRCGHFYRKQKRDMAINSMSYRIDNILNPYVNIIWSFFKHIGIEMDLILIFILQSNGHFKKIGIIITIHLLPHSSHISQMLDATTFNVFKMRYKSTPGNTRIESKFTKKLMQIKKSVRFFDAWWFDKIWMGSHRI